MLMRSWSIGVLVLVIIVAVVVRCWATVAIG